MTLEDFFTLTEMKDGLTAPARVKELLTIMQTQKDYVVKNVGDATRQWSTVASTIAATENKDCLDLFIQLDGLLFIDRWLKDAQSFVNETRESFVEEAMTVLLQALEKLHIDSEKSVSSGIWTTVESLLGQSSSRVRDRARALYDSWKQDRAENALLQDVENRRPVCDDRIEVNVNIVGENGSPECSAVDISPSRGQGDEEKHAKPIGDEAITSSSSDALQPERVDEVKIQSSDENLDHIVNKDRPRDPVGSSFMLKSANENPAIKEELAICHSEGTALFDTCSDMVTEQGSLEEKLDVPKLNDYDNDAKQMQKFRGSAEEISSVSSSWEPIALSPNADAKSAPDSSTEPNFKNNIDAKDEDFCLKDSHFGDMGTVVSDAKKGIDDESPNHCRSILGFRTNYQGGECNTNDLPDSCSSDSKIRKPGTYFSSINDLEATNKIKVHMDCEGADLESNPKPARDVKSSDPLDKRMYGFELDYSIVDPIEAARMVAIEVEREVGDCREASCSSSEKIFEGGTGQPDSPVSVSGKESQPIEDPPEKEQTNLELSDAVLPKGGKPAISAESVETKPQNFCAQDIDSSQISKASQEPDVQADKGFHGFDLNEEVCSEDMDHSTTPIFTPVPVVSVSRAATAPGLPVTPLQFEGALGWKGSTATSVFRPASPRRTGIIDRTFSIEGSSRNSTQRQDCLDIDLNMSESADDKIADVAAQRHILVSSGLPSGESSVEVSPTRSGRGKFDLNCLIDSGDGSSDWKMERWNFPHRNGHHSPSPSSSSSSMRPLLRNFDLNDQPSFYNDSSDQNPQIDSLSQNVNASGGLKSDDSIISIMGIKVEVKRQDSVSGTVSDSNSRISEPGIDPNLARRGNSLSMGAAVPYSHSPVFGYNGITMPTMSFSSVMHGPGGSVPHLVDSRGAPITSQNMGSVSAILPAFSLHPFIMSMSPFPGSNGAETSQRSFDLNSGLMIEGGNGDSGCLRQPFGPGQGRSIEEHLSLHSSSSSGVGGKRKEPEGGRASFPFNYRPHQSSWK